MKMRIWIILNAMMLILLSCNSEVLNSADEGINISLDSSQVEAVGVFPEVIEIEITYGDQVENYEFLYPQIDFLIFSKWEGEYEMTATITFSNGECYSSSSRGNSSFESLDPVEIKIIEAQVKFIIIVDTNPRSNDDISQFYNYSIDGKYYKKYQLPNAEGLASDYLNTPMNYFYRHSVYGHLDENMVPLVLYSFGEYYNPVTTSQTAMAFYDSYIENNSEQDYLGFINNADWLVNHMDENGYLQYTFEWTHGGQYLTDNWISAMAQGQALAVMCMAYHQTADEVYLAAANLLFGTLKSNRGDYWCVGIDSADYLWLEEYPNEDFCHVLNGTLFALWGIWDYYCLTEDQIALEMLEGVLRSVLDHYPTWNFSDSTTTKYCWHNFHNANYDHIHKKQITALRDFFGIEEFNDMYLSFFEYNE